MNFVADESVDRQIVKRLRNDGHSVWYIAEMSPSISDDEVLQLANKAGALFSGRPCEAENFIKKLGNKF